MMNTKLPHFLNPNKITKHAEILIEYYFRYFDEVLIPSENNPIKMLEALWYADFVVVSHGTEPDPIFNFGNQLALNLFEMHYEDFIQLPSRQSAEPMNQQERSRLLEEVTQQGCIRNYTGVRISATGQRFFIKNAKVWNLFDKQGEFYGQAAMFRSWKYLI